MEGLQTLGGVVGSDEVDEVFTQLVVVLVVEAFDRRILDRPVHPLDLTVGPGMLWLGGSVIDIVSGAGVLEGVRPEAFTISHGFLDQRDG